MLQNIPLLLDQYDDGGRLFLEELQGAAPPELVKTAADLSEVRPVEEDYALVIPTRQGMLYRFPVTDAGNTLVSAVYFEKTSSALPVEVAAAVAKRLHDALCHFGFAPPASLEKTAATTVGETHYEDVVPARSLDAEDIHQAFKDADPLARRYLAIELEKVAMLPDNYKELYTGAVLGTDFDLAIDARLPYVPEHEKEVLQDLKKTATITDPDELMHFLYEYDISRNLTRLYDKRVPDPAASVYGHTLAKFALRKVSHVTVDGEEISVDKLIGFVTAQKDHIAETFGAELVEQLTHSPADVFGSLPLPHQRALVRMM